MSRFVIEDKDFEAAYRQKGAYHYDPSGFDAWFLERNYRLLARFLPHRGKVLDVGCGEGRLADYLPPRLTWYGVDPAETAVHLAAQHHPRSPVAVGQFETLDKVFLETTFDAVVSSLALQYVTEADLPATLERIKSRLRPQGEFVFSYINCDHALHHRLVEKVTQAGTEREVVSIRQLEGMLHDAGFTIRRLVGTNMPVDLRRVPTVLQRPALWWNGVLGYGYPYRAYHVVFDARRD